MWLFENLLLGALRISYTLVRQNILFSLKAIAFQVLWFAGRKKKMCSRIMNVTVEVGDEGPKSLFDTQEV